MQRWQYKYKFSFFLHTALFFASVFSGVWGLFAENTPVKNVSADNPSVEKPLVEGRDFVFVTHDGGAGGFEAFPDVARMNDGRLLCVFYDGYGHIAWPDEKIFKTGGRISGCVSSDEGKTWSAPFVVYDSPFDNRDPSITALADGTLLCCFFSLEKTNQRPESYRKLGTWFIRSGDNGQSWSEPSLISDRYWVSSPVRVLSNGRWILGLYSEAPDWLAVTAFSDDAGEHWNFSIIPPSDELLVDAETDVIERKDGTLLAVLRHREGERPMVRSVSTDGGATWGEPQSMGFSGHCPYLFRESGGAILLATRTASEGRALPHKGIEFSTTTLRVSLDEGETWSAPITVDRFLGAYPSMVSLQDGSVLIVYYEENGSMDPSNVRARKFRLDGGQVHWENIQRGP